MGVVAEGLEYNKIIYMRGYLSCREAEYSFDETTIVSSVEGRISILRNVVRIGCNFLLVQRDLEVMGAQTFWGEGVIKNNPFQMREPVLQILARDIPQG